MQELETAKLMTALPEQGGFKVERGRCRNLMTDEDWRYIGANLSEGKRRRRISGHADCDPSLARGVRRAGAWRGGHRSARALGVRRPQAQRDGRRHQLRRPLCPQVLRLVRL